ncbi:MAG: sulfoxide reductase heme-binding subunit YedZ [Betaproteobacteria bacterium]|nr:sulfoxide reductase heme-binding subunit YedZ [Betaproteobacteria bacterium]
MRALKPTVFALSLLPAAWLFFAAATDALGPNPAEALIRGTGDWALRFLCITLAITPLRQATGWHTLARVRRMLGLFTWAYALLHALSYGWLDMGLLWADITRDIAKRPFITVGVFTFLGLCALAATSFNAAVRWLGAARWQALHRLVYLLAGTALLHFFWMRSAKHRTGEVAVYAVLIALLLLWRVVRWHRHRRSRPSKSVSF